MVSSGALLAVRVIAGCATVAMIVSPSLLMYRIYKKKDVGVASVIPLVSLLANSHVMGMYGYMSELYFPVFSCFLVGDIFGLAYLSVYWAYTKERRFVARVLAVVFFVLVVLTLYVIIGGLGYTGQDRSGVAFVMGFVADVVAICLYGAPMEKLFYVLKYQSAVFINIHMVTAATVNNIIWFIYGFVIKDWFIISPNIVFMTLGFSTIVLYAIYNPKTHPLPEKFYADHPDAMKDEEGNERISASVVLTPMASSGNMRSLSGISSPAFSSARSPLPTVQQDHFALHQ